MPMNCRVPPTQGPRRGLPLTSGRGAGVALLVFCAAPGRESATGDVFHDPREVAELAVLVDDPGFLAAGRAEAHELHEISSRRKGERRPIMRCRALPGKRQNAPGKA